MSLAAATLLVYRLAVTWNSVTPDTGVTSDNAKTGSVSMVRPPSTETAEMDTHPEDVSMPRRCSRVAGACKEALGGFFPFVGVSAVVLAGQSLRRFAFDRVIRALFPESAEPFGLDSRHDAVRASGDVNTCLPVPFLLQGGSLSGFSIREAPLWAFS